MGVELANSATVAERHVLALFEREVRPDLILLGLGEDGHTASLFPRSGALLEENTLFTASMVAQLHAWRVTATYPLLNAAHHIVFLVAGSNKAQALRQVLFAPSETIVSPASMVRLVDGQMTSSSTVKPRHCCHTPTEPSHDPRSKPPSSLTDTNSSPCYA